MCYAVHSQSLKGVSIKGTSLDANAGIGYLQSIGLEAGWHASYGLTLSGTNITEWADISGNRESLTNSTAGLLPSFVSSYTDASGLKSNPSVMFNTDPGVTLVNLAANGLAPKFSGEDVPTLMIAAMCNLTNGTVRSLGFSWSQTTNSVAALKIIAGHLGTPTSIATGYSANTNQSIINVSRPSSTSTNNWFILTAQNNGTTAKAWNNLQAGSDSSFDLGPTTLDQFTVGYIKTTSGSQTGVSGKFALNSLWVFKRAGGWTGAEVTNAVNIVNGMMDPSGKAY